MNKQYKLSAEQIRPIAEGFGGCIATDRIVVDGCKVGYCYRESSNREMDSGWRFFAGDEDEGYLSDANHSGVYDVNTIANYDYGIVAILDSPAGSAFERDDTGKLVPAE